MLRVTRRRCDVFHETVALNTEAKRGSVGQAHDAHVRCDVRQRERKEMSYPQRRRHRQKVPELVPGAFLHLHKTITLAFIHQRGRKRNLEPGRGVGLHNFTDVASQLGERGADMAMLDNKRLWYVIGRGFRRWSSLQVSAIFASASHSGSIGPVKRWSVISFDEDVVGCLSDLKFMAVKIQWIIE